jgi:hypothetical protein
LVIKRIQRVSLKFILIGDLIFLFKSGG